MASNDIKSELESFREQWRAEVQAKVPGGSKKEPQQTRAGPSEKKKAAKLSNPQAKPQGKISEPPKPALGPVSEPGELDVDEEYVPTRPFGDYDPALADAQAGDSKGKGREERPDEEPVSALEHYEKAVEKEAAGSLGDSLRLYRKAFRMDHRVDLKYKNKHFPAPLASKPGGKPGSGSAQATAAGSTAPAAAGPAPAQKPSEGRPQTMKELIASFAGLAIEPAAAEIEGTPAPPCPMAELPGEILVHILRDVAVLDIASFVRLARVCRRLAYLVATEDQIWRRVCLGPEFGFGGMHYRWQTAITWGPIDAEEDEAIEAGPPGLDDGRRNDNDNDNDGQDTAETASRPVAIQDLLPLTAAQRAARDEEEKAAATLALFASTYAASWQRMFRLRPRVRFGGCYISTVNYIRSGQASTNQVTWGSPVHIVTYYRYLRLYRDGSAVSLLTTAEPADVVHHLTRDAVALHRDGAMAHLPSVAMQFALKGRWRLAAGEPEGDLVVETEGVGKYVYRLDLALRSAGRGGPRNNKLVWRGFHSYNTLTDDWSEFGLKNDKPFFFSRVKSYGLGA